MNKSLKLNKKDWENFENLGWIGPRKVNGLNEKGRPVLQFFQNFPKHVRRLLEAGADPNIRFGSPFPPDLYGQLTPLSTAIRTQAPSETIHLLVEYGAIVNEKIGPNKDTLVHLAIAFNRSIEDVEFLLSSGVPVNPTEKEQFPLLMYGQALKKINHTEFFELLIKYGCDPKIAEFPPSKTTLLINLLNLDVPIQFEKLLKMGANPNVQDGFGTNALMHAASHYPEMIKMLLDYEVDFNLKDFEGKTVWWYAKDNQLSMSILMDWVALKQQKKFKILFKKSALPKKPAKHL